MTSSRDPAREAARDAGRAVRTAGRSDALAVVARAGFVTSGVLHLLIGWIAVQVAVGSGGGDDADQSGALAQVAQAPGGAVLLWAGAVGLAALGLWQVGEVFVSKEVPDRAKAVAKAGVYLVLAGTTAQFAVGSGSSSSEQSTGLTATVMEQPAGRVLIGAVGLVVLVVGGYHVVKGVRKKFLEDLKTTGGGATGEVVVRLGVAGYAAKGVALGIVGALFVVAAVQADPQEASGLDGALTTLGEQPYGSALLIAVALGLAAYGAYSFARARYADL